ncbi:hypothetical protein EZV62_015125 [Acer yangbiense]|uniref:Plastid lipid-associated protein/fibrillin conserved domain-containing protein n=1 Tax=Acer yangbiense TaxID=1000413 RepID=A0A5C7HWM6_9ROSI|nr:hypothetical protein EZV62_015125 [Acer yangbiense]
MATKLVRPPVPPQHVVPPTTGVPQILITTHRLIPATHHHPWTQSTRFGDWPSRFRSSYTTKVAERSSGLVGDSKEIKADLYQIVQGINRGIFGVPSTKKSEIERLVELLESQNPTPDPTLNLDKVGGWWKLVYSTVTILGSKRTKLGLRDFITLGDFLQNIDLVKGKAVNVIKFNVRGLNLLNGQLTIEASFKIASKSVNARLLFLLFLFKMNYKTLHEIEVSFLIFLQRVIINYDTSTITPDQLMNMFRKNYDLLLSIFNPEGWLEISYVDDTLRIGRDDKGNIFILERLEDKMV